MEQPQTNLAFFEDVSELKLTDVESDFFSRRSDADLSVYMLFSRKNRELINNEKLNPIPEVREEIFDSISTLYRQINVLMNDSMTGMFRREQMYNYLEEKIKNKSLEEIRQMSITIASADFAGLGYFNKVSHKAGDTAIKVAADSMKKSITKSDGLLFRMGGDEFNIVIKAKIGKAILLGNQMVDQMLKIDTSDRKLMDGEKFGMPLRLDVGYAELSEGVDVYEAICGQASNDRICNDQERDNAIIDLTYQIADRRAMIRKNISLIQYLVTQYVQNPDTDKFTELFNNATIKKPISFEDFIEIVNITDKSRQSETIIKKGYEISKKEELEEENNFHLKQSIIKEKAEEQLKDIIK